MSEERRRIETLTAEAVVDAVRYALGHAIGVIEDYAAATPAAEPYCSDLVAVLRNHSGTFGSTEEGSTCQ